MKFIIKNDILIQHLQKINRLLTKNISFPIIENILLIIEKNILSLIATNLDIEMVSKIILDQEYIPGKITFSGRKLLDICRHSPKNTDIKIQLKNNKIHINANNSHYVLVTLPSENFPKKQNFQLIAELYINSTTLKEMIEKNQFAIGKEDVRYYLNGMLFEIKEKKFRTVATDGYRLAISDYKLKENVVSFNIIIPRKSIIELLRLLNIREQSIRILIGHNNLKIYIENIILTIQLLEGKYPDYESVLLRKKNNPIILNCMQLKKSLSRVAILSHEKFCSIEINIHNGILTVLSNNQEEETAEDTFPIDYFNNKVEISINAYYILDILNVIKSQNILLFLNPSQSSVQITAENDASTTYVIMLLKR